MVGKVQGEMAEYGRLNRVTWGGLQAMDAITITGIHFEKSVDEVNLT